MNFQYSFVVGGFYLILFYLAELFVGSGVEYVKGLLLILLLVLNIRSLFPALVKKSSNFVKAHPTIGGYLAMIGWIPYFAIFFEIVFLVLRETGLYVVPECCYSILSYVVMILVVGALAYQTYRVSDRFKMKKLARKIKNKL